MIVIGLVLLLIGFLLGIHILWILGLIALVAGLALMLLGNAGRPFGPRNHYW